MKMLAPLLAGCSTWGASPESMSAEEQTHTHTTGQHGELALPHPVPTVALRVAGLTLPGQSRRAGPGVVGAGEQQADQLS